MGSKNAKPKGKAGDTKVRNRGSAKKRVDLEKLKINKDRAREVIQKAIESGLTYINKEILIKRLLEDSRSIRQLRKNIGKIYERRHDSKECVEDFVYNYRD